MKSPQNLDTFKLPPGFRGRSAPIVQLWWLIQATLFACSPQFMYGWRRLLLRIFGAKIGADVKIRPSARITYPWKIAIGNNSWIGDYVELYCLDEIDIGQDVVISQKSYLCTASHDFSKSTFDMVTGKITIESNAWIAADVFIGLGVTIGQGAVVGARSTVFKDMLPGYICRGNPAFPVRPRE